MSSKSPQPQWSENQLILLNSLLDEIIPASDDGRIPSAGTLNVAGFISEQTTQVSGLNELLTLGLETTQSQLEQRAATFDALTQKDRTALMKNLEKQEPDFFTALVKYTYMGYYTDPRIPPLFGLSEKPPHPYGYSVPDESSAEIEALVEPVKKRGICYQKC